MALDVRQDPNFGPVTAKLEQERGLPAGTLMALVGAESGGNPNAVSPVGAQGLTQFMPATAKQYNVDVSNPWDSLRGTADYLYDLSKKYDGNIKAALSHYNGGAYNAQYQVDGTVPDASKVSPKNFEVNKKYVNDIYSRIPAASPSTSSSQQQPQGSPVAPQGAPDDKVAKIESAVTEWVQQGLPANYILGQLKKAGLSDTIQMAKDKGYSSDDIVTRIGGQTLAPVMQAMKEVESRTALGRAKAGAGYAVDDLKAGVSQIGSRLTGNDEQLAQQQQAQIAAEQDPTRRAVLDSTAGTVGSVATKVAPSLALGAATGGSSLLGQAAIQGGIGAVQGALKPTTADGQFLENIAVDGGLGALGGAGGAAIAKAPSVLVKSAQGAMRGEKSIAELAAARDALVKEGINPGAADISARAAKMANVVDNNAAGASWLGADARGLRDAEIAGAIGKRVGVDDATDISSGLVRKAQDNISKLYDDALNGVHVDLDAPFITKLDNIVASNASGSLPSLSSKLPASVANDLKELAARGPVAADTLQKIRSNIGREMASPSTEAGAKQALGDMYGAINDQIATKLPAKNLEAFKKANEYYKNLQPVESMVRMSGDSGEVTVKQLTSAIKQGKLKNSFERGDAPFQDLQQALIGASTGSGGRSGIDAITKAVGLGALVNPGAPVASGIAGNLAMRVLTNPKYRDVLLGLTPVQRNALMMAASKVGPVSGAQALVSQD